MAAIFGQCEKCPKKKKAQRLYGGLCAYHFGHPEKDDSKEIQKLDAVEIHEKELLRKFFAEQVQIMPSKCENCGGKITTGGAPRSAAVAHILPKRHFKSVMIHPQNRWFGCIICHTDYDNKGWSHAVTMKVWPVCVERFREFMTLIKDTELRYLPNAFMDVLHSAG